MGKPTRPLGVSMRISTASPKMTLPPNLILKHRTWCVAIRVPKDLVPLIGKARLVRSTGEIAQGDLEGPQSTGPAASQIVFLHQSRSKTLELAFTFLDEGLPRLFRVLGPL